MAISQTNFLLGLGVVLLFIATPVAAFGAGDIVDVSSINNVNYRHGDIESILAELIIRAGSHTKFSKLDIKRVYFGNWLRDYSQAIDVGGLKQLPSETIRVLLWCLSFMTFGYATGEFEVTADRLGCYRPEEHIDNPKDYADNEDARKYDPRLRAPVDEGKELAIDPETGIKVYIASENAGIDTSAGLVRKLFQHSIELGRNYHKNKDDTNAFNEALRLLGTGLHCLEDFSAHSNYTELALKELGVDAFPHVGKSTEVDIKGKKIFPLVTGTFGMTDFLHSVVGEVGDKVAQSEIEDMENKLDSAVAEDEKDDKKSVLKAILDKIPWEMLEGDGAKPDPAKADALRDAANKKAEEEKNNPKDPNASLGGVNIEEAKQQAQQTLKDMYPILEFHDRVMQTVSKITSKVPGLDELTENLMGALQIFIFSLLAPYIKPIIAQARVELKSSSEGVLKTSLKGQYEVFENDNSTDPTHSMLSKDHFSNVLNPVAGQIAVATVKFVVPRIVEAWADDSKDIRQVIDDILQVFHHPAHRDENREGQKAMFETVKTWWEGKSEEDQAHLKDILSFQGVKDGKNHEGESTDPHGHSHGAPPKKNSEAQEGASILSNLTGGLTNLVLGKTGLDQKFGKVNTGHKQESTGQSHSQSQSGRQDENESSSYGQGNTSSSYGGRNDNETSSYGQGNTSSSYGRQSEQETSSYGQSKTSSHGRRNDDEETSSYGQGTTSSYGQGTTSSYGRQNQSEETSSYGQSKTSYGRNDEDSSNTYGSSRRDDNESSSYGGGNTHSSRRNDDDSSNTYGSSRRDDNETSSYGGGNTYSSRRNDEDSSNTYGSSRRDDNETSSYGGNTSSRRRNDEDSSNTYGSSRRDDNETSSYGGGNTYGSSRRDDNETSSYGRQTETETSSYGGGGYGSSRRDDNESSGYGSSRRDNDEETSGYSSRRRGDNDESEEQSYGQRKTGYGQEDSSESYGGSRY